MLLCGREEPSLAQVIDESVRLPRLLAPYWLFRRLKKAQKATLINITP
jgi:hypothetical protein